VPAFAGRPNGAGKTTTINMLVGFMSPSSGTAVVEGFDIRTDMDRIYTLMGVCPQHDILWETLTARQHMLFYGRLKNLKGEALKAAIIKGLKQVNLLNVIDENAGTFSGGMKRRLSVAVSMIGDPLCAYLDEPSTGLDPASRRTLWECIKEAKQKSAIFLTTHSMEEAEGLCDRLGIFVDGQLRCIGNPKELTSRFGGFYILTITSEPGMEEKVHDVVHKMSKSVRDTYKLSGTQKFEIPTNEITLAKVFEEMRKVKEELRIKDWGISNTTLEEAFIKISRGAVGT
jgi:ABC-type multidrug transport system ATPase subunit